MPQLHESLRCIAGKKPFALENKIDAALVKKSIDYLQSESASESIAIDPYWPKWDSPWWHMLLLHELGLADAIPEIAIERVTNALNKHYLPIFPVREDELPAGVDPLGQIACHCQLGAMEQVLADRGTDIESVLPALRSWYFRYQLPDGGLNCDESAYVRDNPSSSIVSTLPPLEAVLFSRKSAHTNESRIFLERGAHFLASKKLFRSSRTGAAINESWTQLCFPRFFEYDYLRGLHFLLSWSLASKKSLSAESIAETVTLIDEKFPDGCIYIERSIWASTNTRYLNPGSKTWSKKLATAFPLLESASAIGSKSAQLTAQWNDARLKLGQVLDEGLISF